MEKYEQTSFDRASGSPIKATFQQHVPWRYSFVCKMCKKLEPLLKTIICGTCVWGCHDIFSYSKNGIRCAKLCKICKGQLATTFKLIFWAVYFTEIAEEQKRPRKLWDNVNKDQMNKSSCSWNHHLRNRWITFGSN